MHEFARDGSPRFQRCRLALITNQAFSICNFRGPLIKTLIDRGVTVFALAPDYNESSRASVASLGAIPVDSSMARSGMNPLRDFLDVLRLARQLRRLNVNISFAYFIKPVIYGTLAARAAGVPRRFAMIEGAGYVFTEEESPSIRRRLLRGFVTRLYRLGLSHADRVFLLNRDDRSLFVEEGMVSSEKVRLLDGIGLDLDHFRTAAPMSKAVVFVLVARLLREKGVYDYIDAARRVRAIHPEVKCLLLGSVDLNPGSVTEAEVRAWVKEGVIEWPGQVTDVRPWLAKSSVFVLPSYYREGLPRSTQEAMALGRPIITTDAPGCRETVEEGVNGFMVPVRNPEQLARAMLAFVENPDLIAAMGKESRRIAEQKFDVHKINTEIMETMGLVLSSGMPAMEGSEAPRIGVSVRAVKHAEDERADNRC
jgi:glycosyltransferase involved in cell wall biosynthesis